MLGIITGEASKCYKNKKSDTERLKTIDKFALVKRCNYDVQLQVFMYAFMYVDPKTMSEEDYFKLQNKLLKTTRKCQLQD